MNTIEVKGLSYGYHTGQEILNIENLELRSGEHVFIHGPSGSGKTTLLSILCGIQADYQGSVKILGQELSQLKPAARDSFRATHIGYIFQQFNLISYLSVKENILLPMSFHQDTALLDQIPERFNQLLSSLEINEFAQRNVNSLSIGQQQRVAAARAFISKPKILIADEPTSALDPINKENFMNLLIKTAEESEATVALVSHDHALKKYFSNSLDLTGGQ